MADILTSGNYFWVGSIKTYREKSFVTDCYISLKLESKDIIHSMQNFTNTANQIGILFEKYF